MYAEYKDSKQANNTSKELESNIPITIHLKAYYNQDTIPNKDKQSDTQRQTYQTKRHKPNGDILPQVLTNTQQRKI
ncbi:hypothetical protein [Helicobacter trogontum]|uniref:hypothetical protein n=1 Tax=Helicobacter trogontum TaxID=50960 RepID=UPI00131A46AE|nr:hypothetical protein [Helicobacter trogontum]